MKMGKMHLVQAKGQQHSGPMLQKKDSYQEHKLTNCALPTFWKGDLNPSCASFETSWQSVSAVVFASLESLQPWQQYVDIGQAFWVVWTMDSAKVVCPLDTPLLQC